MKLSLLSILLGVGMGLPQVLWSRPAGASSPPPRANFRATSPLGIVLMLLGDGVVCLELVNRRANRGFLRLQALHDRPASSAVGVLSCIFVQDFLAVRGLAVVLLLLAKLMVDTGRAHLGRIAVRAGHPGRGLMCSWSLGIWFTITPWKLRDILNWATATESRTRFLERPAAGVCAVRGAARPDGVSRDVIYGFGGRQA